MSKASGRREDSHTFMTRYEVFRVVILAEGFEEVTLFDLFGFLGVIMSSI